MCEAQEKCDVCGTTRNELLESKRFGCARCYAVFRSELPGLLGIELRSETMQTVTSSSGLALRQMLQEELSRAVSLEEYEQAAELRDRLRQLGNGG